MTPYVLIDLDIFVGISYLHRVVLIVNFHDIYYSNGWPIYKAWYERLIAELRDRDYKFVKFSVALDELKP